MKIRSFRLKILLSLVATVAVLTIATLALVTAFVRNQIVERTAAELGKAERIFSEQQARRFRQLEDISDRLVGSRRLAAALEEGDPEVLLGVAQNEQEISKLTHTFLAIADETGKPLVRAWQGEFTTALPGGPSPEEAFLRRARSRPAEPLRGYFAEEGTIYEALCVPLRTGEDTLGSVVVAFAIDNRTADELAAALGRVAGEDAVADRGALHEIEVAFAVGGRIAASTIAAGHWPEVESLLGASGTEARVELQLGEHPYAAFVSPLPGAEGRALQVILISQRDWLALLRSVRNAALLCGAGAIVLCFLLSARLARGISAPVSELEAGARQIRAGNLAARVQPRTDDELGRLAEAFNAMAEGLQLKEKYRGVLDKVVSPEVAGELLSGKIDLGGELRTVTVLFCDVRGFTQLTAGMAPHAVLALLNRHMTAMTEIVRQHGGIVDKFVGDELMAVFGAPQPGPNDAVAAVRAARAMIEARQRLNRAAPPEQRFEIGIGLNTGEVVAGNMGSDKQLSYTVLGETVNLAARLCKAAAAGQVLASAATTRAAVQGVEATPLEPIRVRGFAEAIEVFAIGSRE